MGLSSVRGGGLDSDLFGGMIIFRGVGHHRERTNTPLHSISCIVD